MKLEEAKKLTRWEAYPPEKTGGQTIGRMTPGVKLICDELQFEVCVYHHKSQFKNKETAWLMFELYMIDISV